jgi:MSHA biogenesis protein MshI
MIDFPVERATIEVLKVPAGSQGATRAGSLFAVAAKDDTVRQRARLFESADSPLEAIDIPELAQRNISALLESEGRPLGMLGFDASGGLLTITQGGELLLSRFLDVTAENLNEATGERRGQLLERVGLELQRSLDFFDRQPNSVALSRLLIPALPPHVGMLDYFTNNLSVPVEVFDLESVLDFSRVPALKDPMRQGQCLHILGASLRDDTRPL